MPVDESCNPARSFVEVDTANGEHLIYRITAESADPNWSLATQNDDVLANSAGCPSPCERKWPLSEDELPAGGDEVHALAMQFLGGGKLELEVTRHDQGGAQVQVVKKCTYTYTGERKKHADSLRVFVT